jgi:putative peptidoglycan lipid II flippase
MIFGSHLLVRLAFQHQAFGLQDTAAVSRVQAMYAIQVPFYIVSRVFYRYLVAIRRTSLTLYCGAISLFLDVIFNLSLMRVYGVAGIALATSLWTIISCGFLAYWTYRLLPVSEPMQSVA